MEWIDINKLLPEENTGFIQEIFGVKQTINLLVFTDMYSIYENRRIKMSVKGNEWVWFMNIEGERITHYMIAPEPPKKQ